MSAGLETSARRWWILAGACSGLFVLMLDSTVVTLALPAIGSDLGASIDGLQWIQNAYLLALAATVVSAGRLGDIRGRRSVFLAGMALFGAGSVLAGAAGSEEVLIAARVVQGLGGAAMLTLSLALVAQAFPGAEQARALGVWAAVSAIALAIGPLAGGALIEAASWRWIFLINVPIVALGVAVLIIHGVESRDPSSSRVDYLGVAVLAVGLTAIVLGLIEADDWSAPATIAVLAIGVAVLAGFWRLEHRREDPLVEFSLFRNRPYLGASAAAFALVGSYWSVMFFQPQFLQLELGYSAVAAGALILPLTAPMALFSTFSSRIIGRFGVRATMTVGMLFGLAGLIAQALTEDADSYGALLPGLLCFGIALALVYAPMSTAAMAALPAAKSGIASGVLAMNRVLAGALLLAMSGAVFQGELGGAASAAGESGFATAVAHALWPPIGVMVIGTTLTWLWVRAPDQPEGPAEAADHHRRHRRFHL
jgi:EmrB/QacA subfamily drug resistance transporter